MAGRRAHIHKSTTTGHWNVTHHGGTYWESVCTKRFNTWRDAYDYACWWTTGPDRRQSDYTLARGGDA